MAIRTTIIFCYLIVGLCGIFSSQVIAQRSVTVDDLFGFKRVSSPVISPDGKWVTYTVRVTSLEEEKSVTRIWMKPVNGGEAVPMTQKTSSARNPQWSPDGKYLSFISARNDDKSQVWVLNRKGGEAQQLTDVEQGIEDYTWHPEGTKLALVIKESKDQGKEEKDKPRPVVINRLQFKRDYAGYLDTLKSHIHVYDIAADSLRQLTSGRFNEHDPVWSPDGQRIAFVSNRTENPDANNNSDIWVIRSNFKKSDQRLRQVTTNPGSDYAPAWSPDGSKLAYVSSIEPDIIWYATNHLAVASADGENETVLTRSLDRNVRSPRFSANGESIYFLLEDSGEQQLASVKVNGSNLNRHIEGNISVSSFDIHDSGTIALTLSRPHLPREVFIYKAEKLNRLTDVNQPLLDSLELAEVRNIHFKSNDGTDIEGFMTLPIGYEEGKRYPALLRIHGGPVAQFDFSFNFNAQLFAANGYVVLNINPRGSSGYGQEFSHAIWADWGNKDYQDVMAGVDYAIEEGYANPDKLGVGGWSYGGILTNYVVTKTNRFKAAITGASEVLYVSNYGHDHYQLQWEKELGLPWKEEARKKWERISPFNNVENIVTPTLIMGGSDDWNVPILNSEQLYQALKRIGKTKTELVVYPDEHHGIQTPSFQKDRLERYLEWYERFVKNENSL